MTEALKKAIEFAEKLPDYVQDELAELIVEAIEIENSWDEMLASPKSLELLDKLGAEALAEHRAGKTIPLEKCLKKWDEAEAKARLKA